MSNIDRVASSPERVHPLLNGAKIPEVSVKKTDGTDFDLARRPLRPSQLC